MVPQGGRQPGGNRARRGADGDRRGGASERRLPLRLYAEANACGRDLLGISQWDGEVEYEIELVVCNISSDSITYIRDRGDSQSLASGSERRLVLRDRSASCRY